MTARALARARSVSFSLALSLSLALPLALASGCGYAQARARDFSQILRVEAGVAFAFDVDTRLGGLLDFGLGGGYSWDVGLLYGEPYAGKQLRVVAPGVCRRALGPTRIWSHTCPSVLPPLTANETYELPDYTHLGTRLHEFDIEVEVSAIFVHVRFGLSPGELADALLGIFTIDIAGDDRGQKPPPYVPAPPLPPPSPHPPTGASTGPAKQPAEQKNADREPVDLSAPRK
jgi:hypothetical protein